ncbi:MULTISPECIES: dialkylrecorsinol condensing enzyme DarA [Capnocytophaga]|jgi:dialkylrecorsinol condensing enzyme darA|uniref:dialkylrecorsinol condensing enzyme DarA n=1 Tax=Capnocytophaga TaxID=1016 RepID=UPI00248E7E95|nr:MULTISPECIES: dialkylrecorsinol condensing enzyme DarA [Capnocytophaga]
MKRILVIYYTQSGQLKEIADNFVAPFQKKGVEVDFYQIEMETPFPFPWTNESFFWAFPESFLEIPQPIKPVSTAIMSKEYDLIVLAYQVWYLSPSIPVTSFLKSEQARALLERKPVVTLSGTRNMWIKAQEKVRNMLVKKGACIVANIALTDRHYNHISVLTIVHWLFTGKKDKYLGIFPLPGVSQKDITNATQYGELVLNHSQKGEYQQSLQKEIVAQGGVQVKPFLLSAEKKANRLFGIWARAIYQSPRRKFLLKCFHAYLYFAIWILMPIVWLFYWLTYPLFYKKIRRDCKEVAERC